VRCMRYGRAGPSRVPLHPLGRLMADAVLRIVGVDTSLSATGVAVIDPDGVLTLQRVKSKPTTKGDHVAMLTRLERIVADIRAAVRVPLDEPRDIRIAAAIEGPSYGSKGAAVHDIAGLWWMTFRMLSDLADAVVVIPPATLKQYVTGKGNAPKDLVLMSIVRQHEEAAPADNNEADALGMAAMIARQLGGPIESREYAHMTATLAKVAWPSLLKSRAGSGTPGTTLEGSK
jgi:crossover junction endodeoxyribonuclease RuvC